MASNIRFYCPKCGEDDVFTVLAEKRLNQQLCNNCEWTGEPFEPEVRKIVKTRKYRDSNSGGFRYETYDKYGQINTFSIPFSSKDECRKRLLEELLNRSDDLYGGPYTGLIWPDYCIVEAEVYS